MVTYKGHYITLDNFGKIVSEDHDLRADTYSELTAMIDAAEKAAVVKINCLAIKRTRDGDAVVECTTGKLHGRSSVWISYKGGGRETMSPRYLYPDTPENRKALTRIVSERDRLKSEIDKLEEELSNIATLKYSDLIPPSKT